MSIFADIHQILPDFNSSNANYLFPVFACNKFKWNICPGIAFTPVIGIARPENNQILKEHSYNHLHNLMWFQLFRFSWCCYESVHSNIWEFHWICYSDLVQISIYRFYILLFLLVLLCNVMKVVCKLSSVCCDLDIKYQTIQWIHESFFRENWRKWRIQIILLFEYSRLLVYGLFEKLFSECYILIMKFSDYWCKRFVRWIIHVKRVFLNIKM